MDYDQLTQALKGATVSYDPASDALHVEHPNPAAMTPEVEGAIKDYKPILANHVMGRPPGPAEAAAEGLRGRMGDDPASRAERFDIGVGGGMMKLYTGAKQALGLMSPEDEAKWADAFKTLDAAEQQSGRVRAGDILGGMAATAPLAMGAGELAGMAGKGLPGVLGRVGAAGALGAAASAPEFVRPGETRLGNIEKGAVGGAVTGGAFEGAAGLGKGVQAGARKLAGMTRLGEQFGVGIPAPEAILPPSLVKTVDNTSRKLLAPGLQRATGQIETAMENLPQKVAPDIKQGMNADRIFDMIREKEQQIRDATSKGISTVPDTNPWAKMGLASPQDQTVSAVPSIRPTAQKAIAEELSKTPEVYASEAAKNPVVRGRLRSLGFSLGEEPGLPGAAMPPQAEGARPPEDFANWRNWRSQLSRTIREARIKNDGATAKAAGALLKAGDADAQAYVQDLQKLSNTPGMPPEIGQAGKDLGELYALGRKQVVNEHLRERIGTAWDKATQTAVQEPGSHASLTRFDTSLLKEIRNNPMTKRWTPEQVGILEGASRLSKLGAKGQLRNFNPPTGQRLAAPLLLGALGEGAATHTLGMAIGVPAAYGGAYAVDSPAASAFLRWLGKAPANAATSQMADQFLGDIMPGLARMTTAAQAAGK